MKTSLKNSSKEICALISTNKHLMVNTRGKEKRNRTSRRFEINEIQNKTIENVVTETQHTHSR